MTGLPTPERITAALDMADLHGPEVDAALGVPEPTVDLWEAGKLRPTDAELQRLALLTGFPVKYFYLPVPEPFVGFICRRGRGSRCEFVDERPAVEPEPLFGQGRLW